MNIMSTHYQNVLKKQIESTKGEKITDGQLAILENLKYVAEKIEKDGEEKLFLSSKVKQMIFHMICPNGRIERTKEERKNIWTEVTVSVYEDKDDQYPIGSYTSICLYDSICQPISNNEKIKSAIGLAEGAALTRALTRAGIGLEFFTDFDLEIESNTEAQAQAEQQKQEQEEKLANALTIPTFDNAKIAPVEKSQVEPVEVQDEAPVVELTPEPVIEPQTEKNTSKKVKAEEPVVEAQGEQPAPAEKKPRSRSKKVAEKVEVTSTDETRQMSFVESEKKVEMTLAEAYAQKIVDVNYPDLNGKTLQEIVSMEKQRWIWLYYPKAPLELCPAIELVVADLCEKDEIYKKFVELRPYEKRKG